MLITLHILGREQASLTGERLKALSLPYTRLIHSTMTRATETASLILDKLDELPVDKCDMLREGAPIPPEPPVGSWRPEMHVSFISSFKKVYFCDKNAWYTY